MRNNKQQLEAINNTIATINNYSDFLLETRKVYDSKDENLLKELIITTRKDGTITGSRKITNEGRTNQKIVDFTHNIYCAYCDIGVINK